MTEPIQIRAVAKGEVTEVRMRMPHPMETGQRKDAYGQLVPAHFITEVTVRHNGRIVLAADFGPAISRDPYLSFKFRGAAPGDTLAVSWADNHGATRSDEVTVS